MRKKIGSGITDSNGVASCNYTGKAVGKMNVVAETKTDDRILQSEIYDVWDTIFYDDATTNGYKNPNWTTTGSAEINTGTDGTVISKLGNYISTITLTGDFQIEFEMYCVGNARWGVVNDSLSKSANVFIGNNLNWRYFQLIRVGSDFTAKVSDDGVNWTNLSFDPITLGTEDCTFRFNCLVADRSIGYRNLKAYHI